MEDDESARSREDIQAGRFAAIAPMFENLRDYPCLNDCAAQQMHAQLLYVSDAEQPIDAYE